VIKSLDHITTYDESSKIVISTQRSPEANILSATDPYMPGEVIKALTRSYQIKQFTWTTGAAVGDNLYTEKFPYALLQVPFLADKIKYYAWLRAKVKISFRVNSTKFDYGALMISHLPFYQDGSGGDWRMKTIWHASMCNPKVLSAQQGSTIEFELPWVNPNVYALTSSPLPEIGTVMVKVMHPLSSASADPPPSITVTVFANFVEPELAGFAPDVAPPTPAMEKAWLAYCADRQKVKAESEAPKTKKVAKFKKLARMVGEAQSKSSGKTVAQEAEEKTKTGVLSGIADAVTTVAPLLTAIPVIGEFAAPAGMIAGALSPIFKMFGLNKPTMNNAGQIVLDRAGHTIAHGRGGEFTTRLAIDPDNMLSVARGLAGPDEPQPTMLEILKTPVLLELGSFNNTTLPNSQIFSLPAHPSYCKKVTSLTANWYSMSYMAYYGQFASFWRGALKYRIHFTTSSFVTCRVRIAHIFEPLSSNYDLVSGDLVSRVVDIAGDTIVDLTLPFLDEKLYLPTMAPEAVYPFVQGTGTLDISLVNPIVSVDTTANPRIFYSVWVAAGDDFRFMQFGANRAAWSRYSFGAPADVEEEPEKPSPLVIRPENIGDAQCDVRADFNKVFPGLVPTKYVVEASVVNGEDFGTLNTLMHRYVTKWPQPAFGTVYPIVPWPSNPSTLANRDTLNMLLAPFQFFRGAIRLHAGQVAAAIHFNQGPAGRDNFSNGVVYSGGSQYVVAAEVPWYDPRIFVETVPTVDTNPMQQVSVYLGGDAGTPLLYSVGDDWSVGSLSATPWYSAPVPIEALTKKRVVFCGQDITDFLEDD